MAAEWQTISVRQLVESGIIEKPMDGNHGEIHPKSSDFVNEGIPFVMASDLKDGKVDVTNCAFISEEQARSLRKGFSKTGDVLISHKATMGRTAIVDKLDVPFIMLTPQVTYYRVVDKSKLNNRYLKFYFDSPAFQSLFENWGYKGSTRAYLGISAQLDLPIVLPPIEQQNAIANILGTLDDKAELNRKMNETLEAIARAIFRSWFVDFDPVRAKAEGRDPDLPKEIADLFPHSFEDSELGEIPQGWHVTTLNEVLVQLETGDRPKGGVASYSSGVPSIGAESILGLGIFDYAKTKYIPQEYFDTMNRGRMQNRDVLLYKDGGRPGEYEPHLTLFGEGFPFEYCAINEHVYRLKSREDFGQSFLFFCLSSSAVMEEMRVKGTGVAVPGLNSTQVKSLTILVPTFEITRAFNSFVESFVTRVLLNCKESRTLADLRDELLPKLISGKLRSENIETFREQL